MNNPLKYHAGSVWGYTLVELMIVVVIVGILASLSVTGYNDYIVEGCRMDARVSLEKLTNEQEQFYFDNNRYANDIDLLPIADASSEGYYRLSTEYIADDPNTFVVQAVQIAGGNCLPENDLQYRTNHADLRQHRLSSSAVWTNGWD